MKRIFEIKFGEKSPIHIDIPETEEEKQMAKKKTKKVIVGGAIGLTALIAGDSEQRPSTTATRRILLTSLPPSRMGMTMRTRSSIRSTTKTNAWTRSTTKKTKKNRKPTTRRKPNGSSSFFCFWIFYGCREKTGVCNGKPIIYYRRQLCLLIYRS